MNKYARIPGIKKKGNPVYDSWRGMMRRCYEAKNKDYKNYGARGIGVCKRWQDFKNFHDDMSRSYKKALTLERINFNTGYKPSNCCWIEMRMQSKNRRNVVFIKNPETNEIKSITEWCIDFGISRTTVQSRLKNKNNQFNDIFYMGDIRNRRKII